MSFSQHTELLILTTLKELNDAIGTGDINKLKEKIHWFHQDPKRNKDVLYDLYKKGNEYVSQTNLILAACRNKQVKTLDYILNKTDILDHFPGTSFDNTVVKTQRTEAFKDALKEDAFNMIEMLYDYWSGDLYWIEHDNKQKNNTVELISRLETLGKLLKDARKLIAVENSQLQIDIHSLITFNDFQQKLYASIRVPKGSKITPENTVTMLKEMLQIYDDYSQVEKVRIPYEDQVQERKITADLQDSSDYMKAQVYNSYQVYFRKLDFNVALLILENLFVLRQYLKDQKKKGYFEKNLEAKSVFREIQYALYHFIYRTCEDWNLYLDPDRPMTRKDHHTGIQKGTTFMIYDREKLTYGAVLFLERKQFSERLDDLKKILFGKRVISTNNNSSLDDNHNFLAPKIMNDYYSLRKVVYYIKFIEDSNVVNVLMIERVLQVTGEMLKSTDNSNHLLESTKSLLHIAISVETVKCICNIRDFLSHAENGQLSRRIEQNVTNKHVDDIKQDLKHLKESIESVLDIIKSILDKWLLEYGIRLLNQRIKKLPKQHFCKISRLYKEHRQNLMTQPLLQELMKDTGLTRLCFKEIIWICKNKDEILLENKSAKEKISEKLVSMLPTYVPNIKEMIQFTDVNKADMNLINTKLIQLRLKKLSDFPKKTDIDNRIKKVKEIQQKDKKSDVDSLLKALNKTNYYSDHRKAIIKTLSFYYDNCNHLRPKPQINLDTVTYNKDIKNIIDEMENKYTSTSLSNNLQYPFDGIKKLGDDIEKLDYRKSNIIVREKLISDLISRVYLLKKTLHPQHNMILEENLRRYKDDRKFRLELEMLLADIGNILVVCKIQSLMNKPGKILREINLRNVLVHGNPFLDVIGGVFDTYDLSNGLVSKAIMVANDGASIKALFKLFFQEKIDYDTTKEEKLGKMNNVQKKLYKKFQKSKNWQAYVELLPKPPVN